MDKLTEGQHTFVRKRVQRYSKQRQYYVHTYNLKAEHGLPFCVKFPMISQYFEDIPQNHIWSQHHQRLYNGMFFVPAEPDLTEANFIIPPVQFGELDVNTLFKKSPEYLMLKQFKRCYDKMHINKSLGVTLMKEDYDFSKDDKIIPAGTLSIIHSTIIHIKESRKLIHVKLIHINYHSQQSKNLNISLNVSSCTIIYVLSVVNASNPHMDEDERMKKVSDFTYFINRILLSIKEGNTNQIGRDAWNGFITYIVNGVAQFVNWLNHDYEGTQKIVNPRDHPNFLYPGLPRFVNT